MKLFLITIVLFVGLVSGRLPDNVFTKCSRNSPDLPKCIIEGIDMVRPLLIEGIPEISFPSLDPFKIDSIPIDSTNITGVKLRGEANDIVARGAANFNITKLKIDIKKNLLDMTVVIPKLSVNAEYVSSGSKIFGVTIDSTGTFSAVFRNIKARVKARGHIDHFGELEYLRLPKLIARITFGIKTTMHIEPNETDKNSILTANLLNSLPSKSLLMMLKSPIDRTAERIIQGYVNKVLDQLPLQDLLLD